MVKLIDVVKEVANQEAAIQAAHRRIDEMREESAERWREFKGDLNKISDAQAVLFTKLEPLFAEMHQAKGRATIVLLLCSGLGGVAGVIVTAIYSAFKGAGKA